MKKCIACERELGIDKFYRRRDGTYRNDCKKCLLSYQSERWKARKAKAVELFGGKCAICGYDRNLAAFEFHHVDPSNKEYVWNQLQRRPWNEVVEELKKCILVCRNCHAEIHHPNFIKVNVDASRANRLLTEDRLKTFSSDGECPTCNSPTYGTKYCSIYCANLGGRKVPRPSKKELEGDIEIMSWLAIGRKYGVSDNAVRKWAKRYGIPLILKQRVS